MVDRLVSHQHSIVVCSKSWSINWRMEFQFWKYWNIALNQYLKRSQKKHVGLMISTIGQVRFGSIAVCLSKLEPPHFNWKFVMIWILMAECRSCQISAEWFYFGPTDSSFLQVINIKANQAFHRITEISWNWPTW